MSPPERRRGKPRLNGGTSNEADRTDASVPVNRRQADRKGFSNDKLSKEEVIARARSMLDADGSVLRGLEVVR